MAQRQGRWSLGVSTHGSNDQKEVDFDDRQGVSALGSNLTIFVM
jgi:hypothetical protein